MSYEVGQTVVLVQDRREPQEVQVVRVGRKIVYVGQYGRERGFYMDIGVQSDHKTGTPDRIYTPEEFAYQGRLIDAQKRLRELGVEIFRASNTLKNSAEKLERIIQLIEEN